MDTKPPIYSNRFYRAAKRGMFEAAFRSGAVHAFRRRRRDSVAVLIYHDILPPNFPSQNPLFGMTVSTVEFEWQLGFLRNHYNPITFEQFAQWFLYGAPLPPYAVLITFDDGHKNNLEVAFPLLRKYEMPAVLFVVAGALGTANLTWFEDAYWRLMFSPAKSWTLKNGEVWPLKTAEQRAAACGRFFQICRSLRGLQQDQEVRFLRDQLSIEKVNQKFTERFEFLADDHLRFLKNNGIEIGAHTMSHPILATISGQRSKAEICESKRRLESALRQPVRALAYPFGAPESDFGSRDEGFAREGGFQFAFAGEGGFVRRDDDPFRLPRIGIGQMTRAQFAATVTGTTESLKALIRRGAA
jgi:peptidoglycan/xylan/chitin deacetylase (PgdA/CDA1 family)